MVFTTIVYQVFQTGPVILLLCFVCRLAVSVVCFLFKKEWSLCFTISAACLNICFRVVAIHYVPIFVVSIKEIHCWYSPPSSLYCSCHTVFFFFSSNVLCAYWAIALGLLLISRHLRLWSTTVFLICLLRLSLSFTAIGLILGWML